MSHIESEPWIDHALYNECQDECERATTILIYRVLETSEYDCCRPTVGAVGGRSSCSRRLRSATIHRYAPGSGPGEYLQL